MTEERKPMEFWIHFHKGEVGEIPGHVSEYVPGQQADWSGIEIEDIHVREVIEDEPDREQNKEKLEKNDQLIPNGNKPDYKALAEELAEALNKCRMGFAHLKHGCNYPKEECAERLGYIDSALAKYRKQLEEK